MIGLFLGSNGTVNIDGFKLVNGFQSTWTATGLFDVGDGGSGTINVTNSGELRTNSATLGVRAGGFGHVLVAGTPSTRWLVTNGNVSVDHTGTVTWTTPITGAGQINHLAAGTTTLSNTAAYTGGLRAVDGLLVINGATNATSFRAQGSGTLRLQNGTLSLGTKSIRADAGGTVEYQNETINGGFLRGPGTHVMLDGSTNHFNGVTSFNSTQIVQNVTSSFKNFQNGGNFISNGTTRFDGANNGELPDSKFK